MWAGRDARRSHITHHLTLPYLFSRGHFPPREMGVQRAGSVGMIHDHVPAVAAVILAGEPHGAALDGHYRRSLWGGDVDSLVTAVFHEEGRHRTAHRPHN